MTEQSPTWSRRAAGGSTREGREHHSPRALLTQPSTDPQGEHHGQQANTLLAATHVVSLLKTSQEQHLRGEQPRQRLGLLHGEAKGGPGVQGPLSQHGDGREEGGLAGETRRGGQQLPAGGPGPRHGVDTPGSRQQTGATGDIKGFPLTTQLPVMQKE